jgi:hypothetical protein
MDGSRSYGQVQGVLLLSPVRPGSNFVVGDLKMVRILVRLVAVYTAMPVLRFHMNYLENTKEIGENTKTSYFDVAFQDVLLSHSSFPTLVT